MNRTRVNTEEIAFMNGDEIEHVIPASLINHLGKFLTIARTLPNDDIRVGLCIKDIPALTFTKRTMLMLSCVRIVGMHLHRQIIMRVQDFNEQWEAIPLGITEELMMHIPQVTELLANKRTGSNNAIAMGVSANCPALSYFPFRNVVAKVLCKAPTSPNLLMKDRLKNDNVS